MSLAVVPLVLVPLVPAGLDEVPAPEAVVPLAVVSLEVPLIADEDDVSSVPVISTLWPTWSLTFELSETTSL